ncbi:Arrestin family protein 1 [Yarrowia sp. C11]|nr:Arrestin family protein 1 [Yarrowia sp. E02]KAG5369834.1 Arrestin family protein 1 [Yarrowia sp. C11]
MFPIDVSINGPPNEDIVFGFPGIAASWPRLEGSVEIRSKDGSLQKISLVSIALYRTDTIHAPSSKPGINAPKKEQSFLIGQEQSLFRTSAGRASETVVAMDLPFIYEMPTNRPLPASISLGKNSVETTYKIFVTVTYGSNQIMHTSHPIRIKRYDTLSTFGSFKVPVVKNVQSADHLVDVDYTYPVSSFGPLDPVQVYIKVAANPDIGSKSKRVKLVKVSIQIVEVITYNPEGDEPIEKRRKVVKTTKQVDQKLSRDFKFELSMDYPQYEPKDKDSIVAKERQDVPTIAMSGFTAKSSLYRVEYLLVIKAKFSGAKDIESQGRITVSPFGHATCMSFMASIGKCVEQAKRVDKKSKPPVRLYRETDAGALWFLGVPPWAVKA